jgi:hypothetical protein
MGDPIAELEKLAGQKAPEEESPGSRPDGNAEGDTGGEPGGPEKG